MITEVVIEQIKKLRPQKGDILVFRLEGDCNSDWIQGLAEKLREKGIHYSILITVAGDSDIYVLDEEMMDKFGWVKKAKMPASGATG